jgi:hypothetical protein
LATRGSDSCRAIGMRGGGGQLDYILNKDIRNIYIYIYIIYIYIILYIFIYYIVYTRVIYIIYNM